MVVYAWTVDLDEVLLIGLQSTKQIYRPRSVKGLLLVLVGILSWVLTLLLGGRVSSNSDAARGLPAAVPFIYLFFFILFYFILFF